MGELDETWKTGVPLVTLATPVTPETLIRMRTPQAPQAPRVAPALGAIRVMPAPTANRQLPASKIGCGASVPDEVRVDQGEREEQAPRAGAAIPPGVRSTEGLQVPRTTPRRPS